MKLVTTIIPHVAFSPISVPGREQVFLWTYMPAFLGEIPRIEMAWLDSE